MKIHIIVGKNYGDEGKGLAVDYFAERAKSRGEHALVIRHNGGAQAGHTVDRPAGRFIFHQLSSGSFAGADTFWADTFLPDLYKVEEERQDFRGKFGLVPDILAQGNCRLVLIDDVLLNMAAETARGKHRHGSCGMGINEAVNRCENPEFALLLKEFVGQSAQESASLMGRIRREYLPMRLQKIGLSLSEAGEYGELLRDDGILLVVSEQMHRAAERIRLVDLGGQNFDFSPYGEILFEGAQGLLLDNDCREFYPYTTPSKTGCHNPVAFCRNYLSEEAPEMVYVTRSYVTRHGAGPLPCEITDEGFRGSIKDATNIPNDWQGTLRFAKHPDMEAFVKCMEADLADADIPHTRSLFVTHLNETGHKMLLEDGEVPVEEFLEKLRQRWPFSKRYLSDSMYGQDVRETEWENGV